jgi:hypothetical protein
MNDASTDYRIFGFDEQNRLRANLYNGPGHPETGVMYSWLVCATSSQLADKLAEQWEQPLTEVEIPCDECGGSGVDPGGLNAYGPEDCPVCHGSKRQTITRNYLSEAFAITSGQSDRPIERKHLTALDAYSRQLMNAYAGKVAA